MAKYAYLTNLTALEYIYSLNVTRLVVKVFILNQNDIPLRVINGYVTGGSISVNGSSLIRRTGSISLVTDPYDTEADTLHAITELTNLIALNKRVSIEVGIENTGFDSAYKDIDVFWFPMGAYIIDNPSVLHDENGVKITLKLNDKMVLLNGTSGGLIPLATTLSPYEDRSPEGITTETSVDADGNVTTVQTYKKVATPIIELIQDVITEFSEIPLSQIVVENVERRIRNKVSWQATKDNTTYEKLYMYQDAQDQWHASLTDPKALKQREFKDGDTVGYYYTDFVYPEELTTSNKDNVAAVLTKIRDKLGNFEFFFDTEGIFHFREIRNYLNQGSYEEDLIKAIDEKYILSRTSNQDKTVYDFTDGKFISAYTNNPNYNKIKNDITVWAQGNSDRLARRYHLLIDAPERLHTYKYETYVDNHNIVRATDVIMDQVGCDYIPRDKRMNLYLYYLAQRRQEEANNVKSGISQTKLAKELIEFWPTIYNVNPATPGFLSEDYSALTYYFDILDVSKLRYNKDVASLAIPEIGNRPVVLEDKASNCLFAKSTELDLNFVPNYLSNTFTFTKDTVAPITGVMVVTTDLPSTGSEQDKIKITYFEQGGDSRGGASLEDVQIMEYNQKGSDGQVINSIFLNQEIYYKLDLSGPTIALQFFNYDRDQSLPWAELTQMHAQDVLSITVATGGQTLNSTELIQECVNHNNDYVLVSGEIYNHLALGQKLTPASEYVRSVLHEYIGYNNSITLTSIPLYHLDVNSRISVEDDASDIHGDYIIQSLTIPLDLSGKMTINATKAVERI